MVGRYTAGAADLPSTRSASYFETDLPKANPLIREVQSPYGDGVIYAVPPLKPDVTIVHAQRADAAGNTQVWGLLGCQKEAAFAADRVIVVVEELVDEAVVRADPNRTIIPGLIVDAVVVEPYGAHPSYVQGAYDRDNRFYLDWDPISRDEDALQAWLRTGSTTSTGVRRTSRSWAPSGSLAKPGWRRPARSTTGATADGDRALPVTDVERAGVLPRRARVRGGFDMLPAFAMVRRGDLALWLAGPIVAPRGRCRRPRADAGQLEPVRHRVDDLDPIVARLRDAGATSATTSSIGLAEAILVDDPDGNPIELFEAGHERRRFSKSEMMIVAAARELAGQRVCFVGVGLPNIAVNLAKRTVARTSSSSTRRVCSVRGRRGCRCRSATPHRHGRDGRRRACSSCSASTCRVA